MRQPPDQRLLAPRFLDGGSAGTLLSFLLLLALAFPEEVAAAPDPAEGRAFRTSLGQRMVWIPPGTFTMGAAPEDPRSYPSERLRRTVRVASGFWMSAHEVTQVEYQELAGKNPSRFRGTRRPVEGVSYEEALRYCARLTDRERSRGRLASGWKYSLPSEAQWEYAARAGGGAQLAADQVERHAQGLPWSRQETAPVGQRAPNAWGLHDMLGNVWEWCLDGYGEHYPRLETDDRPRGPAASRDRVTRGGSWMNFPEDIRPTARLAYPMSTGWDHLGFRVVLVQEGRWPPELVPIPAEVAPVPCASGFEPAPGGVTGAAPGERRAQAIGLRLRWVPGEETGTGFWIGEGEVTQAEYRAVMGENPSLREGDTLPVERVSWAGAMRFARRLGEIECAAGRVPEGWGYRLPRAAEWERAFEVGGGRAVPPLRERTRRADDAEPDALGLRDMVGNVWEWCLDPPAGDGEASMRRSIRGGSYRFVGVRSWTRRVVADESVGFRVVLAPVPRRTG